MRKAKPKAVSRTTWKPIQKNHIGCLFLRWKGRVKFIFLFICLGFLQAWALVSFAHRKTFFSCSETPLVWHRQNFSVITGSCIFRDRDFNPDGNYFGIGIVGRGRDRRFSIPWHAILRCRNWGPNCCRKIFKWRGGLGHLWKQVEVPIICYCR